MSDFKLPELGENVHGGDVLRVLVKAGDAVKAEQPVLELETDKATIEVPSSVSGTVGEVKVKAGDKVNVGQTIFTLEEGTTNEAKEQAQPLDAAAEGGQSQRVNADRNAPAASKQEAEEKRESDTPGKSAAPPQRATVARAPRTNEEALRQPRRGEVVDIRAVVRASRRAAPAADSGPASPLRRRRGAPHASSA
jgi:pyruvate dehydrogenase E2 component (dihydrolipoamide acetyltransferase)